MSIINKRREALVDYLVKELGVHHIKDFSDSLRELDICDLKDDKDLEIVTSNGMIDTLLILYKLGTTSKMVSVKKMIEEQRNV